MASGYTSQQAARLSGSSQMAVVLLYPRVLFDDVRVLFVVIVVFVVVVVMLASWRLFFLGEVLAAAEKGGETLVGVGLRMEPVGGDAGEGGSECEDNEREGIDELHCVCVRNSLV